MTPKESAIRDFAIRSIGCICCMQHGYGYTPCEKHHLNEGDQPGRKRRGEKETVGLCQWHHVGKCFHTGAITKCPTCTRDYGPSWRHDKRAFLDRYGDGDTLLAYQDARIVAYHGSIVRGIAA